MTDDDLEAIVTAVKRSKKYRHTHEETIRELATAALQNHRKPKQAIKAVRAQLHSIMAPYLGDPDYEKAVTQLDAAFSTSDETEVKAACYDIMSRHLSTRERLPIIEEFYPRIFEVTGRPKSILDVACGLNPLSFPWMEISIPLKYHAYDIHESRIGFLNHYFVLQGLPPLARLQDVAIHTPEETADLALFLKEMPRFERNYGGQGRKLLRALRVRHIVISFPSISTHGGRSLVGRYREFFRQLVQGEPWSTTELLFEGELVFCVKKEEGE